MKIGITGASGLIGTALSRRLAAAGHEVHPFVRTPPASAADDAGAADTSIAWQPAEGVIDRDRVAGLDAIVHLAGAGIGDQRWTSSYRDTLVRSRIDGTSLLAATISELGSDAPQTLLSGSAIGFYGARGDEQLDESSARGAGFLSELCETWESTTAPAALAGTRVAHLRTGIVLSDAGGVLRKLLPIFKLGLGGRFGSGEQWMSWISITDEVRAIEHLLTADVEGPVNLTAPNPVRNREFVGALGRILRRPVKVPVPRFGPRLLVGSQAAEALIFTGQRVTSTVLPRVGFAFEHDDIEAGLRATIDA